MKEIPQDRHLIIKITAVEDGPHELMQSLPNYCRIFRRLNHSDGSEYYLAELLNTIEVGTKKIEYVVVGSRFTDGSIMPEIEGLPINIAYVLDHSILYEQDMDFAKCEFCGMGECSDVTKTFDPENIA